MGSSDDDDDDDGKNADFDLELNRKVATVMQPLMKKLKKQEKRIAALEELTAKQVKALQESMKGYIEEGQTLSLSTEVDPDILGGLRVQVGDRYIDLSISTKIQRVHGVLSQAM